MVTVDSGLKTYAVGAYSENGPGFGCAPINARRIRLVARWRKGLDAPHPNRTQKKRLIELGYIEELLGGLQLTSDGRARIAAGKWSPTHSK
jgi:hypothetical protein